MRETGSLRFIALLYITLFLSTDISQSQESKKGDLGPGFLTMTVRPAQLEYDLQTAMSGDVRILAKVENKGTETVLFAHPNICFPDELQTGQRFVPDRSQSHLSVVIDDPHGATTILMNNGLRMFDPGFRDSMTIAPDQTATFSLGMFGPEYSLGQWDIDRAPFTETGQYRITVNYRNGYMVAYLTDPSGKYSNANCWTGQLRSNTISLQVK